MLINQLIYTIPLEAPHMVRFQGQLKHSETAQASEGRALPASSVLHREDHPVPLQQLVTQGSSQQVAGNQWITGPFVSRG